MASLSTYFERFLPVIEQDLQLVMQPPASSPPPFYEMLHYHMGWIDQHGRPANGEHGKRLRPVLALLVGEAVCGSHEPARSAGAAVELIHNFSLLHDDIQDGSPLRHNRPTVWSIWGQEQGINAGDALFALAHLAIPRLAALDADPAILNRLLCILDETSLELTRGQYLDMSFETRDEVSTEEYLDMIAGKTAALIAAAARMGTVAAGASDEREEHFHAFGKHLGIAFQVLDDVLDIWGDPAVTGKEAAIDIRQRKKSLPVLYALHHSAELRVLYAEPRPFEEREVRRAIALLDSVKAREYAESLAQEYSDQTLTSLSAAAPQEPADEALFEIVARLLHRDH